MKKVLIVQDNLKMGGIQKALINALRVAPQDEYDITLLLFYEDGPLLKELPNGIKVISCGKRYSILGKTKRELRETKLLFLLKSFLHIWSRLFNRKSAMRLLGIGKKKLKGYDYAISYAHPFHKKVLSGGAAEFILSKVQATKKVCFVHCDYLHAGIRTKYNDKLFSKFHKIACVSNSVRERFLTALPNLSEQTVVIKNTIPMDLILRLSCEDPFEYDTNYINILSVARLSDEKGVDRAIQALAFADRKDLRYYIVGMGPLENELKNLAREKGIEEQIFFMGEQENPYRFMKRADYLLVPSYHEAAPVVFDEANVLGLKIISSNTTSAKEMIGKDGIIFEDQKGLDEILFNLK